MKILALGPTPPPYHGVAVFLRQLADAPLPHGWELEILDTADRRDGSNLGRWDPENLRLGFSHLAELAARCQRLRPDIVYLPISQNVPAFLRDALFIAQARMMGSRVVVHLHGGYFRKLYDNSAAWFREVVRSALACVDGAIVLSPEFLPIFDGLVHPDHVFVVANGCPDPGVWERRAARGENPVPADGGTILFMSTLTPTKGIVKLVESLKVLRERRPNVRLRVAGRWADELARAECETFIARESLAANVEFLGNVDGAAKNEFLSGGDVFCLPTFYPYEGQPLVLIEAMAAGLPVVSTRHAAIASTVPEGEQGAGWLVSPEVDAGELAQTLDAALGDPRIRGRGRFAREHYLRNYTLAACHARLWEVFQACCR